MTALKEVLTRLPALKQDELAQVEARVALLRKGPPPKQDSDWLLEGIAVELRRRGLWAQKTIPPALLPKGYAQTSADVRDFLLKGVKEQLRPVEKTALGALAGAALVDLLQRRNIPVGPKSVLGALSRTGTALEEAFPGYWSSGALGVCLKLTKASPRGRRTD